MIKILTFVNILTNMIKLSLSLLIYDLNINVCKYKCVFSLTLWVFKYFLKLKSGYKFYYKISIPL